MVKPRHRRYLSLPDCPSKEGVRTSGPDFLFAVSVRIVVLNCPAGPIAVLRTMFLFELNSMPKF